MAPWLGLTLGKTEAGRREITERALPLSRAARNLLFSIDAQRSAGQWLSLVRGSGPAELRQLLAAGLIHRATSGTGSAPAGPGVGAGATATATASTAATDAAAAPVAPANSGLAELLLTQGYRELYDRLTAEARPQLGLIKGYKLILDIEKCVGPNELRALALRFVEQVRQAKGETAAHALAQRLASPG